MIEPLTKFTGEEDRRRAPRAGLRLSATMREPGRSRTGVRVIDISTHGCRIEATSGPTADTWLWLSIAGIETQYCRVIWHAQEFAGLEFATPLAEPVLDRLLADTKHVSETTIGELRDIARRTHRLATKEAAKEPETLTDLSNKCAVEAVVEGLKLGEARSAPTSKK